MWHEGKNHEDWNTALMCTWYSNKSNFEYNMRIFTNVSSTCLSSYLTIYRSTYLILGARSSRIQMSIVDEKDLDSCVFAIAIPLLGMHCINHVIWFS